MRSPTTLKPPSPLLLLSLLLTLIFTSCPLTNASSLPHIWLRNPSPADPSPSASPSNFQDLGTVDTITGGEPTNSSPSSDLDDDADPPPEDSPLSTSLLANSTPPTTCASSHLWYTPDLLTATINPTATNAFITDCFLAVQHLYLNDVHFSPRGNSRIEFIAPPGTAGLSDGMSHSYLMGGYVQETPLMYKANSCTLAVVLMGHFINVTHGLGGRGVLPGGIARGGLVGAAGRRGGKGRNGGVGVGIAGKDTSTFRKLHMAGRMIENDCLRGWGRGGWVSAGDNDDIGVFLWATNSTIDRLFHPALESSTKLIGAGFGTSEDNSTSATPPASSTTPEAGAGGEPHMI